MCRHFHKHAMTNENISFPFRFLVHFFFFFLNLLHDMWRVKNFHFQLKIENTFLFFVLFCAFYFLNLPARLKTAMDAKCF